MGRWLSSALLVTVALCCTCAREGVFKTPLVRVDLSQHLPPRARRLSGLVATPYECRRTVELPSAGVAARFAISWRALDFNNERHIAAVEVSPAGDGRLTGVSDLAGSAWVGELTNVGRPGAAVTAVPVEIRWSAHQGCNAIGNHARVQLRADDPGCAKPKTPGLLRPVK
jgi:hypothetical protein